MRYRLAEVLVLLFCMLPAGCGLSDDAASPLTAAAVQAPDAWSFSGTRWTRTTDPVEDDWKVLRTFFDQHPGYGDSADLAGQPIVYRSTGADRMFVWTQPALDGTKWQLVRRQGNRFYQDFGAGVPWDTGNTQGP